ncbi:hypothetical protein ACFX5Q_02590 [Mesorhizobium sp. IMUNJ 23033]|uniref:hypothetical protein n=1 Tax=Mesorhizobium sp. IMUNJ 23033 TaxID=3378039 RepID=UPI00384B85FA
MTDSKAIQTFLKELLMFSGKTPKKSHSFLLTAGQHWREINRVTGSELPLEVDGRAARKRTGQTVWNVPAQGNFQIRGGGCRGLKYLAKRGSSVRCGIMTRRPAPTRFLCFSPPALRYVRRFVEVQPNQG